MSKSIHGSPRLTNTVILIYNSLRSRQYMKQNKKRVSPLFSIPKLKVLGLNKHYKLIGFDHQL